MSVHSINSVRTVRILGGTSAHTENTITAASTLAELVDIVPAFIRAHFKPILHEQFSIWTKINSVRAQIARLNAHKSSGDFPPEIRGSIKPPTFQFSKETHADAIIPAALRANVTDAITKARKTMLEALITARGDELALLCKLTDDAPVTAKVNHLCWPTVKILAQDNGILMSPDGKVIDDPTGKTSPLRSELKFFLANYLTLVRRCIVLAHMSVDRENIRKFAALSLADKATADVAMGGTSANDNATVAQVVQAQLANFAKEYNLDSLRSKSTFIDYNFKLKEKTNKNPREKEPTKEEGRPENGPYAREERRPEASRKQGKGEEERTTSEREGERRRQEVAALTRVGISLDYCSGDGTFHLCRESVSWPRSSRAFLCTAVRNQNLYLSVGADSLRAFAAGDIKCDVLDTAIQYGSGIFRQPGINLSANVEYQLAFNGKYIFHSAPNPLLVHKPWKSFEKTCCWRYIFRNETSQLYIRRFNIPSDAEPAPQDPAFERGLSTAKDLLFNQTAALNVVSKARFNPNLKRHARRTNSIKPVGPSHR